MKFLSMRGKKGTGELISLATRVYQKRLNPFSISHMLKPSPKNCKSLQVPRESVLVSANRARRDEVGGWLELDLESTGAELDVPTNLGAAESRQGLKSPHR